MSNTSNFRGAIREAKGLPILGPNVISKALPFLGAGLVLTAVGAYGGLGMIASPLFMPLFIGAMIAQIVLFFVASNVAQKGKNGVALPLLAAYSLLSGFTLSALIFVALGTQGVGIMGIVAAALGCGIAFIVGRPIGSNLSDKDGLALSKTVSIGIIALFGVLLVQLAFAFFGVGTPSFLEIAISGMGVLLFVGASVVDFYVLPRTYTDEQYLPVALSMYLTYINLFIFILRLLIAINGRD